MWQVPLPMAGHRTGRTTVDRAITGPHAIDILAQLTTATGTVPDPIRATVTGMVPDRLADTAIGIPRRDTGGAIVPIPAATSTCRGMGPSVALATRRAILAFTFGSRGVVELCRTVGGRARSRYPSMVVSPSTTPSLPVGIQFSSEASSQCS